ncbi:hypothetical protein PROAA_130024 [Candidatus Propionivibrio aalborgensis]|uniref:Uncharacterized protein n=1 Tax=Candidatus Propionivibrio aalborgensis TaxID=1860101 RepID=A0A1A8XH69_9RHOO|nr:hypothetical protein PROAA_130024 [Candidatus Propionivibrio aalborgensis]
MSGRCGKAVQVQSHNRAWGPSPSSTVSDHPGDRGTSVSRRSPSRMTRNHLRYVLATPIWWRMTAFSLRTGPMASAVEWLQLAELIQIDEPPANIVHCASTNQSPISDSSTTKGVPPALPGRQ